jgi:hypothetical protein
MIVYQDFVAPKTGVSFYQGSTYETFSAAVAAANEWVRENAVRVINVETVVLPDIFRDENGTDHTARRPDAIWFQFVRVWYEGSPLLPHPEACAAPAARLMGSRCPEP